MSFYVVNILTIRGEPSLLDDFIKENEGIDPVAGEDSSAMPFSFNQSVPLPASFTEWQFAQLEEWRNENWGADYIDTTGDAWTEGETNRERTIIFASTNGVPDKWLKKTSKLYPEIQFEMSGLYDESTLYYVCYSPNSHLADREVNFSLDDYDQLMEKFEEEPVKFSLNDVKALFKPSPEDSPGEVLTETDYAKLLVMLKWNYPEEEE